MKKFLESITPHFILDAYKTYKNKYIGPTVIEKWKSQGYPVPTPHYVKQQVISNYQQKFNYQVLIETGTYLGDMVHAQKKNFKELYSIELSNTLYNKAKKRFYNNKHITLLQGDSGELLSELLSKIKEPTIFWLDGHYSKDITAKAALNTPIISELKAVFNNNKNHVILIDDARCFNGTDDYPTIQELEQLIQTISNSTYTITIQDDIIHILPKK